MKELYTLDNSQLIDLLAKYTSDYTRMLSEGTTNEGYEACKNAIKALQAEIELRRNPGSTVTGSNTDITPPPDFS